MFLLSTFGPTFGFFFVQIRRNIYSLPPSHLSSEYRLRSVSHADMMFLDVGIM